MSRLDPNHDDGDGEVAAADSGDDAGLLATHGSAAAPSLPSTIVIPDNEGDGSELRGRNGDGVAGGAPALLFAAGPDTPDVRAQARKATERFLRTLDPTATRFDFRAIDDRKGRGLPTRLFTKATLAEAWSELWRLNQFGYGIFVMVSATDGRGQKGTNVARVRAVIADCDGVDPSKLVAAKPPHMAVRTSPGKCHLYWLTSDCPLNLFKPLHEALIAQYGTDKNVKDLPRVLRLPGFYHNKAEPLPVRFASALVPKENRVLPPYTVREIIDGLGLDVDPAAPRATAAGGASSRKAQAKAGRAGGTEGGGILSTVDFGPQARRDATTKLLPPPETPENVAIVRTILAVLDPDCGRDEWRRVLWSLLATKWACAEELARGFSARSADKFDEDDFLGVVRSFDPAGGITFATLIHLAREAGYTGRLPVNGSEVQAGAGQLAEIGRDGLWVAVGDGQRPIVMVEPGQIAATASKAEDALRAAGAPIYQRGGKLVQPVLNQSKAAGGRTTITASFKEVTVPMLVDWLNRCADFQRWHGTLKKIISIDPPRDAAETILSRRGQWKFLPVSGCVTSPVLRSDGTLLTAAGYDAATELYHFSDPSLTMPSIPEKPSRADAEAALALIGSLLDGFPFVGPIDRSAALSAVLTAVLRGGMGTAPMHLIRAHTAGTGKSHLVDVATTLAAGYAAPAMAAGSNPDELEKRLVAAVRDGSPFVNLDNVNGTIGGTLLCQIAERQVVTVRPLGKSEPFVGVCKAAVFCNGNNTTVEGDLVRRTITSNLDAGIESPETRHFNFDPLARVQADRGRYLAAVLTIAMAYRAAGCPDVDLPPLGSYSDWTLMVRAPLVWLGTSDPVASQEAARAEDPVRASIREVMAHWTAVPALKPDTFYKAKHLLDVADHHPDFQECLHRHCGRNGILNTKMLGGFLSRIHGQVLDGRRIVMRPDKVHGHLYALTQAEGGAA